jgi:mannosyltransferase OCH1-like enzyme
LEVRKAYDILVPGAYRADLFRYCYLYINGGIYIDNKIIERIPLRDIILSTDTFIICNDYTRDNIISSGGESKGYLNSVIMSVPNNKLLKNMIDRVVDNILNKQAEFLYKAAYFGCKDILDITGPTLFYKVLQGNVDDTNIRFKHIILNRDESCYRNFQIVDIKTKKEVFTKTNKSRMIVMPTHYSNLWMKCELFYRNWQQIGNYIFQIYPFNYPDQFKLTIKNDNIVEIRRTDSEDPWWINLTIIVINDLDSSSKSYEIPRRTTSFICDFIN